MRRHFLRLCLCLAAMFLFAVVHTAWAQRIGRFRGMDVNSDAVVTAEEFAAVCNFSGAGYFEHAAGDDVMTFDEYDAWLDLVRAETAPHGEDWGRHFTCHP